MIFVMQCKCTLGMLQLKTFIYMNGYFGNTMASVLSIVNKSIEILQLIHEVQKDKQVLCFTNTF